MEIDGGFVSGTFGFPYSREWREIGRWFGELPNDEEVMLVTNEKRQFVTFYLPSNVRNRIKYNTHEFPGDVDAPQGLYVLIVYEPQSWTYQFWGLTLGGWREEFLPLHEFVNDEGKVVASLYFLTQEQLKTEFQSNST
jgi:hypothetical protein